MLKNMKGMQLQIEKLSKEGETRHAVEKRFEKNSYPRRSIQFQSRAGWKNYLTNEQKRDRLNKPCYSATGEMVGEYKDGRLKIDRHHIHTWDSKKTPGEQKEAKKEHNITNKAQKRQHERNAAFSHQLLLERDIRN